MRTETLYPRPPSPKGGFLGRSIWLTIAVILAGLFVPTFHFFNGMLMPNVSISSPASLSIIRDSIEIKKAATPISGVAKVDQHAGVGGPSSEGAEIISPANDATTESWRGYKDRTIMFIHVGKAGGMTLRTSTLLVCMNHAATWKDPECVKNRFPDNATLALQMQYVFHMNLHGNNWEELEQSTSFVVALRNPVDRLISSFRYSHPVNCIGDNWGCRVLNDSKVPGTPPYNWYNVCYPEPGMEEWAQNTMSPYPPFKTHGRNMTAADIDKCRTIAALGTTGRGDTQPNPHMYYDYRWYFDRSVQRYPTKEVFAIRTEHELDDLRELDISLGGVGNIGGEKVSHGSETYAESTLTQDGYEKLCCMLEDEIHHYNKLLNMALNLNDKQVLESMDGVRKKCNITTSWEAWRAECKARLKMENRTLGPKPNRENKQQIAQNQQTPKSTLGAKPKRANKPSPAKKQQIPKPPALLKKTIEKMDNRTITLVQIGSSTLARTSTSVFCLDQMHTKDYNACVKKNFPLNAILSRQVKHVFYQHLNKTGLENIKESTSFMATLENPVDRLLSLYWKSHPNNCDASYPDSWSCRLKQASIEQPEYQEYRIFNVCFPSSSIEDFAQSTMSPYPALVGEGTPQQQSACRELAFGIATGKGISSPIPEMYFNYEYYLNRTILSFPTMEFFGIRHENELADLKRLDRAIGGLGNIREVSASQEIPAVSEKAYDISETAYRKLCCVMEKEIWNYKMMLKKSINLSPDTASATMEKVRQKCGFTGTWARWQQQCRAHVKKDADERKGKMSQ